ncbi:MAG: sodium/calcium exchanger rane region [Hyphomicrobiales bacterium]|nr:sodium/calcium exchanger rane region [Hyphomicrobiales bacterium]
MSAHVHDKIPVWSWLAPLGALIFLGVKVAGVVPDTHPVVLTLAAILLGSAVFAAVHHAEVLAAKVGEPFGSILLAIAVTIIEVALILSIMLSAGESASALARDTVFSAVMIVLNGVVGLCLLVGGNRFHEQSVQIQGASASLAVLGTLATVALVLPNFTTTTPGPYYSASQLIFVGAVSLCLYLVFVFVQTVRHRSYFLEDAALPDDAVPAIKPGRTIVIVSSILLPVALTCVVLIAKLLSYPLDRAVAAAGLPHAVVGVVIAGIVLLPEGIAALNAALANRLQGSVNLALGSAIASIGLTIPAVTVASLSLGTPLALGLSSSSMVLLYLTLYISALSLVTGRTTILQGAIHLVIFGVFLFTTAVP